MSKPPQEPTIQLPLELPMEASARREDLIESPANSTAVAMIDAWPDWPGSLAVLAGPVGSGKSHLSSVWISAAGGIVCPMTDLSDHLEDLS